MPRAPRVLLALDTANTALSVCVDAGGPLARAHRRGGMRQDDALIGTVDAVLRKAGCALEDVAGIAVTIGPGRFTGVRIGLTFAAVAGDALGIPVAGVRTLDALVRPCPHDTPLAYALLKAGRDEVFVGPYESRRGVWAAAGDASWMRAGQAAEMLRARLDHGVLLVGGGTATVFPDGVPAGFKTLPARFDEVRAEHVLALARPALLRKRRPPRPRPFYLKPGSYEKLAVSLKQGR